MLPSKTEFVLQRQGPCPAGGPHEWEDAGMKPWVELKMLRVLESVVTTYTQTEYATYRCRKCRRSIAPARA